MNDSLSENDSFRCIIDSCKFEVHTRIRNEEDKTTLIFRKCRRCFKNQMLTLKD